MLKLVLFFTKRSFPSKKPRNFCKFFSAKTKVSTVKYYFRCKVLFSTENLVFGVKTGIFITKRSFPTKKTRNFYKFFYTETQVSTVKYYCRCKVLFSKRKPRFGVKTGIFITKRSFPTKKTRNFYKFFSEKTEVSTVKYYFRCKVLFSSRKPRFGAKAVLFFTQRTFPSKKPRNFCKIYIQKLRFPL